MEVNELGKAHGLVLLHAKRWKNNCHLWGPEAWLCLPGEHGKEDWNLRGVSSPGQTSIPVPSVPVMIWCTPRTSVCHE